MILFNQILQSVFADKLFEHLFQLIDKVIWQFPGGQGLWYPAASHFHPIVVI